ncbi:hypothetical protein BGX26_011351 [Mortierella sp. AD094]|nr:hypothetical protein BGX26_011351 [Mortierella sp. AD094]
MTQVRPQPPFLDGQNNPTLFLENFANALFDHLDRNYEPKGTHLLEPSKMVAFELLRNQMDDPVDVEQYKLHLFWMQAMEFTAFSVEIVFTEHGNSVTRAGFLTYIRSEFLRCPDEAFQSYSNINREVRVIPSFIRSQVPENPDPKMSEIDSRLDSCINERWEGYNAWKDGRSEWDRVKARVKAQNERQNVLSNTRTQMADRQTARNAQSVDFMSRIGTGVCYECGKKKCRCYSTSMLDI